MRAMLYSLWRMGTIPKLLAQCMWMILPLIECKVCENKHFLLLLLFFFLILLHTWTRLHSTKHICWSDIILALYAADKKNNKQRPKWVKTMKCFEYTCLLLYFIYIIHGLLFVKYIYICICDFIFRFYILRVCFFVCLCHNR